MTSTPVTTTRVTNQVAPKKSVESLMPLVSSRRNPMPSRAKWMSLRPKDRRRSPATVAIENASRLPMPIR